MQIFLKLFLITFLFVQKAYGQNDSIPKWGDWKEWGDAGNGTYNNPVVPADYSDIDCIRVKDEYFAISSTFQYSPGIIILQSKDLVNWAIAGHVVNDITTISPEMNWDKMNRYAHGIWAGAIRYHDKKFWIYFGTPDEGYFMTTAKDIKGPWQPLHKILDEKGWDDCCPFWDDDGQGYLVGSHFSDGYKIHLWKMNDDGRELIRSSDTIIHQSKGSEANKLYKINGMYYHLFSEVTNGRALMMERSSNIYGPYTQIRQLSHTQKEANEPNQGGLVQTQNGQWYFLTHHGTGDWSGRIMSLLPVCWIDGWPIIGKVDKDSIGDMVWNGKLPLSTTKKNILQARDEFNTVTLNPQWEWNYQPRIGKWSLKERKGWLRLHAFKPIEENNLLKAGNTITQRTFRTATNTVIIKIDIGGMADGQKTGLSHFGLPDFSAIGVSCQDKRKTIEYIVKGKSIQGPEIKSNILWFKSCWGLDGLSRYYYSIDGKSFIDFGEPYQMKWGSYRGDRIAIYSYNNKEDKGYVDVDFFHYDYSNSGKQHNKRTYEK